MGDIFLIAFFSFFSFWVGYNYPRDVELESTAPVEFHYEVTPEVARLLVLRDVKGCGHE
jgi:hypothetical protein